MSTNKHAVVTGPCQAHIMLHMVHDKMKPDRK